MFNLTSVLLIWRRRVPHLHSTLEIPPRVSTVARQSLQAVIALVVDQVLTVRGTPAITSSALIFNQFWDTLVRLPQISMIGELIVGRLRA
jgi:hypothetical protein